MVRMFIEMLIEKTSIPCFHASVNDIFTGSAEVAVDLPAGIIKSWDIVNQTKRTNKRGTHTSDP